jgi:hypothetical protein
MTLLVALNKLTNELFLVVLPHKSSLGNVCKTESRVSTCPSDPYQLT